MKCLACQDAPGTEVPGTIGALTVPMLCAACRVTDQSCEVCGNERSWEHEALSYPCMDGDAA